MTYPKSEIHKISLEARRIYREERNYDVPTKETKELNRKLDYGNWTGESAEKRYSIINKALREWRGEKLDETKSISAIDYIKYGIQDEYVINNCIVSDHYDSKIKYYDDLYKEQMLNYYD